MFDGGRCVIFDGSTLGWVRETLDLLVEERRATHHHRGPLPRRHGHRMEDRDALRRLADAMATVDVDIEALGAVREQLRGGRA